MARNERTALVFEVYRGSTLLKTGEFREESVTVGNGSDALLSVDDATLAPLHAVFNIEDDGSVRVLDLGSEAGVLHDGERVTNAVVRPGDTFTMGGVQVIVRFDAPDAFDDEEATHVVGMPGEIVEAAGQLVDEPADEATDPGAADAAVAAAPSEPDEEPAQDNTEDVLSFVLRSTSSQSAAGENRNAPKVLEVHQVWEQIVLDTKHYRRGGRPVTVGSTSGYRWSFIGIEIGWVPAPLAVSCRSHLRCGPRSTRSTSATSTPRTSRSRAAPSTACSSRRAAGTSPRSRATGAASA
jgi:hypothetical protein